MALYHFHVGQISRGKGQSAIAAAAYRSGQRLKDDYYGKTEDYTRKNGVVYEEIILPSHAPPKLSDRETLWNEVESIEKNPKAQLCYSFDIALQNELSMDENIALARQFIMDNFVSRGMICDMAIHDPEREGEGIKNPHFHVLCPMRPIDENGEWGAKQRREYKLDEGGNRIRDSNGKYAFNAVPTTDWGRPETLDEWRKNWADMVNTIFEEKGLSCRVDHRSYKDRGVEKLPQVHEGNKVRQMEQKGIETEKGSWNKLVKKINSEISKITNTIKSIMNWVSELKEELSKQTDPTLWDYVVAYSDHRDEVAKSYPYGYNKAVISNLNDMVSIYRYLNEHDIRSVADFAEHIASRDKEVDRINALIRPKAKQIEDTKYLIKRLGDYKKYLPAFDEMNSKILNVNKEKFKKAHQKELNTFYRARRELREAGIKLDDIGMATAKLKAALETHTNTLNEIYKNENIGQFKEESKMLKHVREAVEFGMKTRCPASSDMLEKEVSKAKEAIKAPSRTSINERLDSAKKRADSYNGRSNSKRSNVRGGE